MMCEAHLVSCRHIVAQFVSPGVEEQLCMEIDATQGPVVPSGQKHLELRRYQGYIGLAQPPTFHGMEGLPDWKRNKHVPSRRN